MLKSIFLCLVLSRFNCKHRGVAMTEYAILLAFIAAVAVAFVINDYAWNEDGPTSFYTAIQYSIMKAWSAIDMAGSRPSLPHS